MQQELSTIANEYLELLNQQKFDEKELDYSIMDKHAPFLTQLSQVGNSGVTVFDMYRQQHIFASYNFTFLFGYDMDEINEKGNEYFDSKIHPDDRLTLMKNAVQLLRLYFSLPKNERNDHKVINEYRILNAENKYIRVIEQHQLLEADSRGNAWLSLGIIDISPNQDDFSGVRSQVLNFKTGRIIDTQPAASFKLTKREKEILSLVKEGYLSKEISEKLSISLHTVNTHRQRILEKMNADNSMEAVKYASKFGLVS
jgi:DNA-binding CsgD family transcriptional regulator